MSITIHLKDGSKQVIHPKTSGENKFNGDPRSLALDMFGSRVDKVTY